jgi:hypothetical protein
MADILPRPGGCFPLKCAKAHLCGQPEKTAEIEIGATFGPSRKPRHKMPFAISADSSYCRVCRRNGVELAKGTNRGLSPIHTIHNFVRSYMDFSTPVLAILIAISSLALSLHTSVATRRASQLQRLAAIRTQLSSLMWKTGFDLSQYERCAKKFDQFLDEGETTFEQDISFLKDNRARLEDMKTVLDSVSSTLRRFPLSLGAGRIDELEHRVGSISQGVDIASEKLLPRMLKLVERIKSASGEQISELPNPSSNTDAAR